MKLKVTPDALYRFAYPYFRGKRLDRFAKAFSPSPSSTVLDVGGCPGYWEHRPFSGRLTLLNLPSQGPEQETARWKWIHGDGTKLEFPDGSFDIVHSNSVIEHLGTWERQRAFANELRRVGRGLWVQTPARCFPVECHTFDPIFHWFPKPWRRPFLCNFTVWGWMTRPNKQQIDEFLETIQPLTHSDMKRLFPDCAILRERFAGMTKSYIAFRPG